MRKFSTYFLMGLLFLGSFGLAAQSMMPLPPHASTFTANPRGFWFIAPTDFIITGLRVPTEASTGPQSVQLVRFADVNQPGNYTTLAHYGSVPGTGILPVNEVINTGDVIGILGVRDVSTNSYGTGSFPSSILGFPVTLERLWINGQQIDVAPVTNAMTLATTSQITRVEMYYSPLGPCVSPPFAGNTVANPASVCINNPTTLSVDSLTLGQGSSFQWQMSTDNISWTNMVGDTFPSASPIVSSATQWYRLMSTCGGVSTTSTPVQVFGTGTPLAAGTYTINSNATTAGTNFQSFGDFISSVECAGVAGPVILNVVPGSGPYNERVVFDNVPFNATSSLTINGNGETIEFNNTTSERAVIELVNTNHVTFDSLVVKSLNATFGWGFWFTSQADSNTVKNCVIDITSITNTTANNSAGIVMSNTNTSVTTAGDNGNYNLIENNSFLGTASSGPYSGVVIIGSGNNASVGNIVRNNFFQNFHLWGVRATNAAFTVIDGNDISRPNRSATGIVRGIYLTGSTDGVVVSNNRIHNILGANQASTSTIYALDNSGSGTASDPTQVFNNKIYDLDGGGTLYGIYNAAAWSNYYHNTVVVDGQTPKTQATYGFFTTVASNDNVEVFNNIIYMDRNTSGLQYAIRVNTATVSNFNSNNNGIYIGPNATGVGFRTTGFTTLADWTNGTNHDGASVAADPVFVNLAAGNLTPTAGAFAAIGQNLLSIVPTDFFGNPRLGLPSPGAIEFAPPPCPPPGTMVTSVTDTSASFFFQILGANGTYNIEWGPTGFLPGTGTMFTHTGDSLNLGGLTSSTCYDIYVQLDCTVDGNGLSATVGPLTFCTECTTFPAPYFQGFESWTEGPFPARLELCYDFMTTNASYTWEIGDGMSPTPNTTGPTGGANGTSQYAFVRASGTANSVAEFYLPPINTNTLNFPELRFFYHVLGTHVNEFRADVFNTTTQTWDAVFTVTQPVQSAQGDAYEEAIVPLTAYKSANTKIRFVGIRGGGTSGQYAIDDISVAEAPACPEPLNFDTLAVNATNIDLEWVQSGNVSAWEIEWGPVGFTQGTPGANTVAVTTNPFNLSGLTPGDCIDIYIRSNCSSANNGFSVWTGPLEVCLPYEHDIALESILRPVGPVSCGDSAMPVIVVLFNNGQQVATQVPITAVLGNGFTGTLNFTYPGPLASGQRDTVVVGTANTFAGGALNLNVTVNYPPDQNASNNNITKNNINILNGNPDILPVGPVCASEDSVLLRANPFGGVFYSWFNDAVGTNLLGIADSINVSTSQNTYYVSYSIGGDEDSLETTFAGNTQLGGGAGHMVDIYAFDNLTLEGFTVHFGTATNYSDVEVWYRNGTMYGFETNQAAWTLHEVIPVSALYVPAGNNTAHPKFDLTTAIPASAGDTIGIFLNPPTGSGFRYISSALSGPYGSIFVQNADMAITVGNAKSSWTGNTNPRMWNGRVHYGKGVGCESARVPVQFSVIPDTSFATFTATKTGPGAFDFDASGSIGGQYAWDFGDGNTATGLQVSHTYTDPGNFTVTLTVTDTACGSDDISTQNIQSTISAEALAFSQSLRVYPNPNDGHFQVSFDVEGLQVVSMRLLNPAGQEVLLHNLGRISGNHTETIDLKQLASGIYLLQVQTERGVVTRRVSIL